MSLRWTGDVPAFGDEAYVPQLVEDTGLGERAQGWGMCPLLSVEEARKVAKEAGFDRSSLEDDAIRGKGQQHISAYP